MSGTAVANAEGVVLVTLLVAYGLWFVIGRLRSSRPALHIGIPIAVGYSVRLAAIAGVGATGLGASLRGGDETTFLDYARALATQPLGHGDLPHGHLQLHTVLFALQLKLGFLTVGALRVTQVGIAMLGLILILAATYDLAGGRAARLAAWLLAFDPTGIFFNSALHKEPNMELAAGLVVFGGTMIWRRLDVRGLLLFALGGGIAVETRSYAGWFLVSAAVLVLLHAALRNLDRPMRAMPAVYGVVVVAFIATPTLLQASSRKNLQTLQQSQTANANGVGTGRGGANTNNLALEQVDFSTRGAILANLPKRIRDLILKPYPWQLGDTSQRVGAVGTLVAYVVLLLLVRYAWLSRGKTFPRAGPLLYPLFFLLVAYSLSAGNAGTGFRYRSHLVTLGVAAMVILRAHVLGQRDERAFTALEPSGPQTSGRETPAPPGWRPEKAMPDTAVAAAAARRIETAPAAPSRLSGGTALGPAFPRRPGRTFPLRPGPTVWPRRTSGTGLLPLRRATASAWWRSATRWWR